MHGVVVTGDSGLKTNTDETCKERTKRQREIHNGVDEQYKGLTIVKMLRLS